MKLTPIPGERYGIASKGRVAFLLLAELLFGDGRDLFDVVEGADALGAQPGLFQPFSVKRGTLPTPADLPPQALELKRGEFIAPHPLYFFVPEIALRRFGHLRLGSLYVE
jgi:hypothetical protein